MANKRRFDPYKKFNFRVSSTVSTVASAIAGATLGAAVSRLLEGRKAKSVEPSREEQRED